MVVLLNVLKLPYYRFSAVPKILRAEILRGKARITNPTIIMDKDTLEKIIMSLGIKIRHANTSGRQVLFTSLKSTSLFLGRA